MRVVSMDSAGVSSGRIVGIRLASIVLPLPGGPSISRLCTNLPSSGIMPKRIEIMPTAFSYQRFSNPEQAQGDSTRRQTSLRDAYLTRKNLSLDNTMMADRGVSAFRGKNLQKGPLADFIRAVDSGKIKSGSYLILEKIDRFSRTDVDVALSMFSGLLKAGIVIVTLDPEREWTAKDIRGFGLMELVVHLLLANEESQKKSDRLSQAWKGKRLQIAHRKLTKAVPSWLTLSADRTTFTVDAVAAATVRKIFKLAATHGIQDIVQTLNRAKTPAIGRKPYWQRSFVSKILHNKAVLGEFQPMKLTAGRNSKRIPIGDPIPDYYPRIITDEAYYLAQSALTKRQTLTGPQGPDYVNLFKGLVFDARSKSSLQLVNKGDGRTLAPSAALRGQAEYYALPLAAFERAFLTFVKEIDHSDVVDDTDTTDIQTAIESLRGKAAKLDSKIASWKRQIEASDDVAPDALQMLTSWTDQRKTINAELEKLRADMQNNASKSLDESKSLIALLGSAEDKHTVRIRLAAAIRNVVKGIHIANEQYELGPEFSDAELRSVFGIRTRRVIVSTVQVCFANSSRHFWYVYQGRKRAWWLGVKRLLDHPSKIDLTAWDGGELYPDFSEGDIFFGFAPNECAVLENDSYVDPEEFGF